MVGEVRVGGGSGPRRHLVIAGPGRSGTTLLVRLLDRLGLDTGADRLGYFPDSHAGLEADLLAPDAPYLVKDPTLSYRLGAMIESGVVEPSSIERVIVPIRELEQAAASRVRNSLRAMADGEPGGIWLARGLRGQRRALTSVVYQLVLTLARYEIPSTLLAFPRFAQDGHYAYRNLASVLPGTDEHRFLGAWNEVVDQRLIHGREELRTPVALRLLWRVRSRQSWADPRVVLGGPGGPHLR